MELIINTIVFIMVLTLTSLKIVVLALIAYLLWNFIKGDKSAKEAAKQMYTDIK